MKVLFTTVCKPIPIFMDKYLSTDQTSFRFVNDQDLFSISSTSHVYSLHFLAQNINVPSVVLEWPTLEELSEELESERYDYIGIHFKCLDIDKLPVMIDRIRKVSPHTQIILGGYGVSALEDLEAEGIYVRDKVNHVCTGEGVAFMRTLLGEALRRPKICHLPLETVRLPWLPTSIEKIGYILSALGCEGRCEFCATSAYTCGQLVEVMTAPEIYESMKWDYEYHPDLDCVYLMDENFLLYREKVNELGVLIRDDDTLGLSKVNYAAFGTCSAVSKWEPDALLLNGVGGVWTGIESFHAYDYKKGVDVEELVRSLHDHGIQTTLSWIIGSDCQTKENIEEDISRFITLKSPSSQLSLLISFPGTALYRRLKQEGRVKSFEASEMHLFGNNMDALHFSHQERLDIALRMYRRIYETNGPSILRATKINMNGYRHCLHSRNPYLNGPKLSYFKKEVRNSIPLVKTAISFAPNATIRKLMEDLEKEYTELFGPFRKSQQIIADHLLSLAEKEYARRDREGYSTLRDVSLERFVYPGRGSDPGVSVAKDTEVQAVAAGS